MSEICSKKEYGPPLFFTIQAILVTSQIENTQSYFFVGVIKGVNRITCRFTPLFAEREENEPFSQLLVS